MNTMPRLAPLRLRSHYWSCFVGCPGMEEGEGERYLGQRFASRAGLERGREEDCIHFGLDEVSIFMLELIEDPESR